MRPFDSTVLLPTCGVRMTFGSARKSPRAFRWHVRLAGEHVQRRTGNAARRQCFEERPFVHDRAAGCVDEPGSRVHLRETFAVDEPGVLRLCGHMQADEIGVADRRAEIVRHEREMVDGSRCWSVRPGATDNTHPVAKRGDARQRAADAATPDHRKSSCPADPGPLTKPIAPLAMLASADGEFSCGGRHEKHGVLCHRLIENARRVGAQHAARGRTRLVDAVVADAEARDDSARRQRIVKRPGVRTAAHDDVADVQIANSRREIVLGSRSAGGNRARVPR